MNLFQNAKFFTTVNHLKDLPDTPAEIAFVGRSNAGKSSAINTLTNHVRLAYVSKTPGAPNISISFELENGNFMVDLPGYGYAQVPEAIRAHWVKLGRLPATTPPTDRPDFDYGLAPSAQGFRHSNAGLFHITGRPVHILLSKQTNCLKNDQIKTLAAVKKITQTLHRTPKNQRSIILQPEKTRHGRSQSSGRLMV